MRELFISENEANQRLDKFLAKYMDQAPKSFFYKMLRKKNITLNGKKATGSEKLRSGDSVKLFLADETIEKFCTQATVCAASETMDLPPIVYEDEHILIVNKPVGLLSQKAEKDDISLVEQIGAYLMREGAVSGKERCTFRPGVCNRLDRNTSGLVTAGKTLPGLQQMSDAFRRRTLKKYYRCLVKGQVREPAHICGTLVKDERRNRVFVSHAADAEGSRIETEYRPIVAHGGYTVLEVHLITGKTHQIRAHLASIGHPIIGDYKYGDRSVNDRFRRTYGLKSQILHAYRLEFPDDLDGALGKLAGKKLIAKLPEQFETIMRESVGESSWERGTAED